METEYNSEKLDQFVDMVAVLFLTYHTQCEHIEENGLPDNVK